MTVSDALKGRWRPEFDKHGLALAARKHFHNALDVRATIEAKRAALAADSRWSDAGRTAELQKFAATEAGRFVKVQRALCAARDNVREQRLTLVPTIKDKTDVAAAMLRAEARAALLKMSQGERSAVLFSPHTESFVLEAAFEGPTFLTGLDAGMKDQVLAHVVERVAGPQVAALNEQVEALDLLDAAVRVSTETLRAAAGVPAHTFDKWLAEVAPVDPKEAQDEVAAFNVQSITATVKALPTQARMTLIDSLLAVGTDELTGTVKAA